MDSGKAEIPLTTLFFLENDIQKSLNTKGETLAIFIDLYKAYDGLWIKGEVQ